MCEGHEDEAYDDRYRGDHEPPYEQPYDNSGYLPPQQNAPYDNQAYPGGNYFPPPPTGEYAHGEPAPAAQQTAYPTYNPADYAPGGAQHQPYPQSYGAYDSEANLGAPYPSGTDTFAGDTRYAPTPEHERRRNNPDDVSATATSADANAATPAERGIQDAGTSLEVYPHDLIRGTCSRAQYADQEDTDGMSTPRAKPAKPAVAERRPSERSQSRVRFNLDNNTEHSPETRRKAKRDEERFSDSETHGDKKHRQRRRGREGGGGDRRRPSSQLMNDKYEREPDSDSDGTVELPPRFDKNGNRIDGENDQLATTINSFLSQAGLTDFLNNLGGGNDDNERRSGRRRHRH